jgi:hypothetical protein
MTAHRGRHTVNLVAIPGSLREASLNKQLLRLAVKLLEAGGAKVDWIDLRSLAIPIYDGDLEASSGLPAGALELAARIAAADGIVIASPVNNFSIPAVVKNWIDWLRASRRRCARAPLPAPPPSAGAAGCPLRVPLEVLGVHVAHMPLATVHRRRSTASWATRRPEVRVCNLTDVCTQAALLRAKKPARAAL